MTGRISSIWSDSVPVALTEKIRDILARAARTSPRIDVFFRADDIARVDERFSRLMRLFTFSGVPLCLAVVPGWLHLQDWKDMQQFNPADPLWCWHQHGWDHTDHEPRGKKSEFGPARSREDIGQDLIRGRKHLETVLDKLFYPVFTPPWNRCSLTTLELLEELDFQAVSRSINAKPTYAGTLPDIAVNVDLHTRKENSCIAGWNNLLAELGQAAGKGRIGFMLHHQLMNDAAFAFLEDILLPVLKEQRKITCKTFRDLL